MKITLLEGLAWLGGFLLACAGGIVVLGNAVEKVVKVWRAIKAPAQAQEQAQDDRVAAVVKDVADLMEWRKEVNRKLGNDKTQLDEIRNGQCATYKALLALLDHDLNGNNIKQMQDARDALLEHLTDPKGE